MRIDSRKPKTAALSVALTVALLAGAGATDAHAATLSDTVGSTPSETTLVQPVDYRGDGYGSMQEWNASMEAKRDSLEMRAQIIMNMYGDYATDDERAVLQGCIDGAGSLLTMGEVDAKSTELDELQRKITQMKIEEAALTGESVPVEKHANVIELAAGTDDVPLGDRKNMCYMGSTVVYGRGRAVVVGTGMNTEMGKIAGALAEAKEELTPLQVKLAELSRILTIMVIVICVVIFGVDIIRHGVGNVLTDPTALLDTFMVAVSLAVAAIPEGLVAVVTIVLSLGVTKMAKRQAIIRKLSAVETLGCTQTICSDKTGTLTQNKMTVVKHELAAPKEKFLAGMALCSDAQWDEELGEAVGEPTECALVNDAGKAGLTGLTAEHPRVGEAPFDSGRKMMSVVVETLDGEYEQYTKGAPTW